AYSLRSGHWRAANSRGRSRGDSCDGGCSGRGATLPACRGEIGERRHDLVGLEALAVVGLDIGETRRGRGDPLGAEGVERGRKCRVPAHAASLATARSTPITVKGSGRRV